MKKKLTPQEMELFIKELVEKVEKELKKLEEKEKEYNLAKSQMYFAESVLVNSLTEEQIELYRIYLEKRDAFFKIEQEYIALL